MMTEEKNEAPVFVGGETGDKNENVETNETVGTTEVVREPSANNADNQPKPSYLRQRWKRKPSVSGTATIREDTTPQPKELKTVEIPTAERLNYPKETFGSGENRNQRSWARDERRGNNERCGCRNRREGFQQNEAHREKPCGCREGKEEFSCLCHAFLKKTKRFFGKLFGKGVKQSEESSCGCKSHEERKRFDRGNRPCGYRRPRRRPGNHRPQNHGE